MQSGQRGEELTLRPAMPAAMAAMQHDKQYYKLAGGVSALYAVQLCPLCSSMRWPGKNSRNGLNS
jgi:hypothetical protein